MMYNNFFWPFGGFFMILFWVVVIWAIIAVIRSLRGNGHGNGGCCHGHDEGREHEEGRKNAAKEILKERYAKGEITKEQFEEMKKEIEK